MNINEDLLWETGAEVRKYCRKELIFREGQIPKFYYHIISGSVTLKNFLEDGKEHIQNFYNAGTGIFESSLYEDETYSANAVAENECDIYVLDKAKFFMLVNSNFVLQQELYISSVKSIRFLMAKSIVIKDPYQKIAQIIELLKIKNINGNGLTYILPYCRQQIANITGLAVETVIRNIKRMESNSELSIIKGTVYLS